MTARPGNPAELEQALAATGYLAGDGLATVAWLALSMGRPLLLEGEPGTGKTALAEALAQALDAELVRLQCYEGIDAAQALYDWDFPRQVLHLRALEAARAGTRTSTSRPSRARCSTSGSCSSGPCCARCAARTPCSWSTRSTGRTTSSRRSCSRCSPTNAVTIPEYGTIAGGAPAARRPDLQPHPRGARRPQAPLPVPLGRPPGAGARGADPADPSAGRARAARRAGGAGGAGAARRRRGTAGADLLKPPGVAESLDWARCLVALGRDELDVETAAATLGAVCKYREDADRVRASLDRLLAG